MITRFDHAVLAVDSLAEVSTRLAEQYGFDVYAGGRHTGLGTENSVVRFGLDYLEILGIYDRDQVVAAGIKRAPLLDFVSSRRGGWLSYCMATNDIEALADRFQNVGLGSLGPYAMQRARPDGEVLHWSLLVPGGTAWRRPWPFFIQWDRPDSERLNVERPGTHRMGAGRIAGVRLTVRDLSAAEYLYSEQIGFLHEGRQMCDYPGAEMARFRLGDFSVELVSPTAPGPALDELEANGEGLSEVVLEVDDQSSARQVFGQHDIAGIHARYAMTVDLMQEQEASLQARLSVA